MFSISEVLSAASAEERQALAEVLGSWSSSAEDLESKLRSRGSTLFQRLFSSKLTYTQIVQNTAEAHGVRPRLLDDTRDIERRLVRKLYNQIRREASVTSQAAEYQYDLATVANRNDGRSYKAHAAAIGGMALAQASGFGVYQMASTVVGALTAAAGISVPFFTYMALSKVICIGIGPVGWIALAGTCLHTFTKPNYNRLVAAIALVHTIRCRVDPCWEWLGRSMWEWTRTVFKIIVAALLLIRMFWGH